MKYIDYFDKITQTCNMCHVVCAATFKTLSPKKYWGCERCHILYVMENDTLDRIIFNKLNKKEQGYFQIQIYLELEITRIYWIGLDNDNPISLNYIVQNINPTNAENKLKTLLTFG